MHGSATRGESLRAQEGRDVERVAERIENAVDMFFDTEENTHAAPPEERDDTSNVATPTATATEGAALPAVIEGDVGAAPPVTRRASCLKGTRLFL